MKKYFIQIAIIAFLTLISSALLVYLLLINNKGLRKPQNTTEKNILSATNIQKIPAPRPSKTPEPISLSATMIAFGDIMLGRNVENQMNKNGVQYSFEKIQDIIKGKDIVFANLEGPIQKNHIPTPTGSVKFSFNEKTVELLKKNNFNILSLANNHTYDYGEEVFFDMRKSLAEANIDAVGHPKDISKEYVVKKKIKGYDFTFIAFNQVLTPFDEKKALELIKEFEQDNAYTIVSIHWAEEYKLVSNAWQKKFAHEMIDNGADIILGHHPHVVEEIEKYKEKIIFYSLGNFIFDQYFSQDTQEGLAINIMFSKDKTAFTLLPFTIYKSQPQLMTDEVKVQWLEKLAKRSEKGLYQEIIAGALNIPNTK